MLFNSMSKLMDRLCIILPDENTIYDFLEQQDIFYMSNCFL